MQIKMQGLSGNGLNMQIKMQGLSGLIKNKTYVMLTINML
jgi:hypothetical protein